jgi:hypothetical protein
MAEIKIEKKMPVWPWALLILAVIGVLIYMFFPNDDVDTTEEITEETTEQPAETSQEALNNSTVAAFVSFIKEDPDQMGLGHEFTNQALSKLTNATQAMADETGYDVQTQMADVKTYAEKITTDPFETSHANSIRASANILAQSLQSIQQHAFPDLTSEAGQVSSAVTAIEIDVLTLDQKGDVKNFFRESADLLEKMNTNAPEM